MLLRMASSISASEGFDVFASRAAAGQEATLTVDPAGLKLFDPRTGANLLAAAPDAGGSKNGVHPGAHVLRGEALGDIAGRSAGGAQ